MSDVQFEEESTEKDIPVIIRNRVINQQQGLVGTLITRGPFRTPGQVTIFYIFIALICSGGCVFIIFNFIYKAQPKIIVPDHPLNNQIINTQIAQNQNI